MCLANNVVGVFKACKVVVFVLMGSQVESWEFVLQVLHRAIAFG